MNDQRLFLERPSFWTEERDPECWCRGLKALAGLESEEGVIYGTPRSLWQRHLKKVLSRRSILGLFGMAPDSDERFLLGVGFLKYHPDKKGWKLAEFSKPLIVGDVEDGEVLKRLGVALLQQSPWVRLLVIRLMQGDWTLKGWRSLRDGRGKLKYGSSLILDRFSEEGDWFSGIERFCVNEWFPGERPIAEIRLHPNVLSRESRRDDFSWAPLKAPLYLFDYLGWLVDDGDVRIPPDVLSRARFETGHREPIDAGALLHDITEREADVRGFVSVEKVLRELHGEIYPERNANLEKFAFWMDAVMSCAMGKGAIEILAAEPGQARHGRGLFGDRQRKLVRWVVHEDLNDCLVEVEHKMENVNPGNQQVRHKD